VKLIHTIPVVLLSAALLTGCDTEAKKQLATIAHTDTLRVDSLAKIRQDLVNEVMASTQFVTEINTELAKARSLSGKQPAELETNTEQLASAEQRRAIVSKISRLVARLDSVQNRLASARSRIAQLSKDDSALVMRVAQYEKSIGELQAAAQKERADFQADIAQKAIEIAALNGRVDTLNTTLNTVRTAFADTVGQLTSEKNTAYYIVGTRDELIKKGVLVQEGGKRFVLVGGRQIKPARELDPASFSKIDRLNNRTISLPEGEYQILSRQNAAFAKPQAAKDGKISGALTIEQPERFWEASRFLIIVRA
jgi:uncharacterized phage infection (PIP) family protein YhgE